MSVFSISHHTSYYSVTGTSLAYDILVPSLRPTHLLVLVNGYQRPRQDFRAFRQKLSSLVPHVATLALDNRGSGETPLGLAAGELLNVSLMAQDVMLLSEYVAQKLEISRYSALGISMGGMIVQTLAGKSSSQELENVFLVSTTAGGKSRVWPSSIKNPASLKFVNPYESIESTQAHMKKYFGERFLKNSPLLFEMMCKNIFTNAQEKCSTDGAKFQFRASVEFDGLEFVSSLKARKVIVVTGDSDQVIPAENSHIIANHVAQSNLIVYPEVGHLILMEESQKFTQDVASFFPN